MRNVVRIAEKTLAQSGLVAVLLLAAGAQAAGQSSPTDAQLNARQGRQIAAANRATEDSYSNDTDTQAQIQMRQVYLAEEVQMVRDSQKLVKLANKLNAEVASQHGSALTPGERKELAAIEKLARSVRTKMEAPVPSTLFQTRPTNTVTYSAR